MKQAKEHDSFDHHTRHAWPTAVRLAIPFIPLDSDPSGVAVHFLDYAIFTVLQLTSTTETPLTITDLLVNGEFRPVLMPDGLSDRLIPLRLPALMYRGSSLGAVLRAPASRAALMTCCYPKSPASLVVATNRGSFSFTAAEPHGSACFP